MFLMCTLPQDENVLSTGSVGGVGEVSFSGSEVTSIGEGDGRCTQAMCTTLKTLGSLLYLFDLTLDLLQVNSQSPSS